MAHFQVGANPIWQGPQQEKTAKKQLSRGVNNAFVQYEPDSRDEV